MEKLLKKNSISEILKTHPIQRTGIGQDSHRFLPIDSSKPCIIGGIIFEDAPGLSADSDGDVVYHSICNAITSLTGVPILGGIARDLCHKDGITDSQVYLERALETLGAQKITHVALTIEGKRPRMQSQIDVMREKISMILDKLSPLHRPGRLSIRSLPMTIRTCTQGIYTQHAKPALRCFVPPSLCIVLLIRVAFHLLCCVRMHVCGAGVRVDLSTRCDSN